MIANFAADTLDEEAIECTTGPQYHEQGHVGLASEILEVNDQAGECNYKLIALTSKRRRTAEAAATFTSVYADLLQKGLPISRLAIGLAPPHRTPTCSPP